MNHYNSVSFFVLLLVVLQVSINITFVASDDAVSAVGVSPDGTTRGVTTDSDSPPSTNSTSGSETDSPSNNSISSDEKEERILPNFCFEHKQCSSSSFCLASVGVQVCTEKLDTDRTCEDDEWCKTDLCFNGVCIDDENPPPINASATARMNDSTLLAQRLLLCNDDSDCLGGFFCKPRRGSKAKVCVNKRGPGETCENRVWCDLVLAPLGCVSGKCKEDLSQIDDGIVYGVESRNPFRRFDAFITRVRVKSAAKTCNKHKDCGRFAFCCIPGTKNTNTGDDNKCKARREKGESCDVFPKESQSFRNRICKKGLKCNKNNICA